MKKAIILFLVIILVVVTAACGRQESQAKEEDPKKTEEPEAEKETAPEEKAEPKVYPLTLNERFTKRATTAPEIVYSTTGDENGLPGSIYYLIGTVKEFGETETDGDPVPYFVLTTEGGDVKISNAYKFFLSNYEEYRDVVEEPDADYTMPKLGEYVKVYCVYSGFSGLNNMPSFYYGTPLGVLVGYDEELLEELFYSYFGIGSREKDDKKGDDQQEGDQQDKPIATAGETQALSSAKDYLYIMAFSHDGLIRQLEHDGFTNEEATYGADNCGADWNEQAVKSAKEYLDIMAFSHDGLIRQLESEKFTHEEAVYGADNCGADWNEQAVKSAEEYLDIMSFSHKELVRQLEHEGFTSEQAEYGVSQNGL